ncbi:MAG: MFS transporter [Clostridia bacterium]|nr:MFS transporter [Clostridia bacterium]
MKLKFGTKLSYGIGGIADNTMYTFASTYLLFYLTTIVGISPAIAGTITAIGSVWEAIVGPITGYVSDNINTRWGKRKPFLLAAAFPIAIVSTLLFTSIDASDGFKLVYYLIMTLGFWTCFGGFFVPYMAWGADLTEDYDDRTVLRSYAYFFNQVGMAVGMVLPTIVVDKLVQIGMSTEFGWQMVGLMVGVVAGGGLLICALTNHISDDKNYVKAPTKQKILSLGKLKEMFLNYGHILKLKPVQYIVFASISYLIANTFFSSDRVYFMTFNLKLESDEISLTMLEITLLGIVLVPFVSILSSKFDKKYILAVGLGIGGATLMVMRFVGISSFTGTLVLCAVYSIANTCYWQLMPSVIYDVCEVEAFASGEHHHGEVISLQALSESLSMAVGFQALGIILEGAGFVSDNAEQGAEALSWIENCFDFIPGLLMIFAMIAILKYPVNKDVYKRMMKLVDKGGEEFTPAEKEEESKLKKILKIDVKK